MILHIGEKTFCGSSVRDEWIKTVINIENIELKILCYLNKETYFLPSVLIGGRVGGGERERKKKSI